MTNHKVHTQEVPSTKVATFEFGTNEPGVIHYTNNGTSSVHGDGNTISANKTYTEGNYTLTFTAVNKVYDGAFDEKGNAGLKLGTSSVAGTFTLTVGEDVKKVVIYVAGYKAKNTAVTVNGEQTTISTHSNDGEYTAVTVDTTESKTISFAVSSNYRCMISTIEVYA
jgi:hypothetical protein